MADFTKFKVGSTSYNVKDANAGRTLAVNGNQLQLKNPAGTAISTVTLPGGGGKAVIAEVTAMVTPDQWGTDEQLTVSRYIDGEYNSLNISDVADLLAKGAVAYISYDNVLIAVDDVSIMGGFKLSATTTVADYNRAYGNPAISGNPTDTVSITITYDGSVDTAVGNYTTGGASGPNAYDLLSGGQFDYQRLLGMQTGQSTFGWSLYKPSDAQNDVSIYDVYSLYKTLASSDTSIPPVMINYFKNQYGDVHFAYVTSFGFYDNTGVGFTFTLCNEQGKQMSFVIFDDQNSQSIGIKRTA